MGLVRKDSPVSPVVYTAIAVLLLGLWTSSTPVSGVRYLESLDGLDGDEPDRSPVSVLQTADIRALQASLPKLYHSPEIFTLSYEEMWNGLQVWIYPPQEEVPYEHKYDHETTGVTEELTSTADLFFRLLSSSDFVTESPKQAQLFLMPVSMDALWLDLGPELVAEQLKRYVQTVRTDFPFWDRSLGADHLYLSCHAFDRINKHRNSLELEKNTIQVACAPLRTNQSFFPHKDMVIPEFKHISQQEIHAALAARGADRATLAYFPAAAAPGSSSRELVDPDADFDVESEPSTQRSSVYAKLARSKFCVSLPPYDALNVVGALRFGCVPVLMSKSHINDLPFQGFLNWREFALVLGLEDLPRLKAILSSVAPAKYAEMQYLGHQASKHLEWNNPPVAYDAFHMTLLELWERRHTIKYGRRETA